ncbi:hypothetical protein [Rothia kristinae]|nr:hypothetical protein [Rothia kristinae]
MGLVYPAATLVLGLAAAFLGVALGHRLVAPASPEREVQDA